MPPFDHRQPSENILFFTARVYFYLRPLKSEPGLSGFCGHVDIVKKIINQAHEKLKNAFPKSSFLSESVLPIGQKILKRISFFRHWPHLQAMQATPLLTASHRILSSVARLLLKLKQIVSPNTRFSGKIQLKNLV